MEAGADSSKDPKKLMTVKRLNIHDSSNNESVRVVENATSIVPSTISNRGARKRYNNTGHHYYLASDSISQNYEESLFRGVPDPFAEQSSLIQYEAALLNVPSQEHTSRVRFPVAQKVTQSNENKSDDGHPETVSDEEEHTFVAFFRILFMCLAQIGSSSINVTYISLLLPQQILTIVGDGHKGRALGFLAGAGGILSILLPPFVGHASDRCRSRLGRRKPFMAAGLTILGIGFIVAGLSSEAESMVAVSIIYIVIVVGGVLHTTAFNATIPDMTERTQYGTTSGIVGALTIIGYGVGASLGAASTSLGIASSFYLLDIVVILTGIVTLSVYKEDVFLPPAPSTNPSNTSNQASPRVVDSESGNADLLESTESSSISSATSFNEEAKPHADPHYDPPLGVLSSMIGPFAKHDFFWVFVTRLLIQFGVFTVMQFMLFWVTDVLPLENVLPPTRAAILFIPVFCTALISSVAIGRLSDRMGGKRKSLLVLSSMVLGICSLSVAFIESFYVAMVFMLVFGFAMGTFMSLDYALVCDVLPSSEHAARDLGVWHISIVLPQLIAAPIGGALLDMFNREGLHFGMPHLGYTVIFIVAALYFFAASACFLKLKNVS